MPVDVKLVNIILKIDNGIGKEKHYVIKFFLAEGQELVEIFHRWRIHSQNDARKKLTFYF
jgi:hypothetical protein